MSKHLAIFLPSLEDGGAERAMLLFATQANIMGHTVDLVCINAKGSLAELVPTGINLVDLKVRHLILAFAPLRRYLNRSRPNVVFSTIIQANLALVVASRFLKNRPLIILRESISLLSDRNSSLARRLFYLLTPYFYPMADAIIAVSHGVAEELKKVAPRTDSKVHVLPTPSITPEMFVKAAIPLAPIRRTPEDFILGIGRLLPQKNFERLIRAYAIVRESLDVHLIILGEGPERPRLEALIAHYGLRDDVHLLGFVSNPFPYLKAAKVFALSSDFEGMPSVLVQAMALGTPVVATNCPHGPAELLENGKLGRLVPLDDDKAFAQALIRAYLDPPSGELMNSATNRYDAAIATEGYMGLIDRLVK